MDEEIRYVESYLYFYFENKFTETIKENCFDKKEVDTWVSLTTLFILSLDRQDYSDSEKKEIFSLLEDMYSSAEVEIITGGGVSSIDLDDIGFGYEINVSKYRSILSNAYKILSERGVHLGVLD